MRPAIKSGLLPVWRDQDTLQIGIDPRRAVALSGMRQAASVIGLLDGSRDRAQVIAAAAELGVAKSATERILTLLAAGGVLDDFPAGTLRAMPEASRGRLASALATASLAYQDGDGGAGSLARRRAVAVWICGERMVGLWVARLLAASGVTEVKLGAGQVKRPDFAVLVGRQPAELTATLVRDQIPHLAVLASEAIGIVGPLVIPGRTSCLHCLDHVRAGYDPAWPLILAQVMNRRPDPAACDAVLAASVAAQTAAQALAAIDKAPVASAAVNGTLELVLPDWRWRRRTWRPHPACPCSPKPAPPATAAPRPARRATPPTPTTQTVTTRPGNDAAP